MTPAGEKTRALDRVEIGALAALCILTALCVVPSLDAPFTFDEHVGIGGNRALRPDSPVGAALAYRFSPDQTRPLFFLSLQTDARLFGTAPRGFRGVNLILHLLCGVVVYGLLRRRVPMCAALAGITVFLLHPVQSESIIYVWARSGVLSTLFALLAMWCALAAGGRRRIALWMTALACAALGLAAKEEAVALPLLFLVWWVLVEQRPVAAGLRRAAILAIPIALFLMGRAWLLGEVGRQVYVRGIAENVLGQALVTLKMLRLVFLPFRQSVDHPVTTPAPAIGTLALLGCVALLAAAFHFVRPGVKAGAVATPALTAARLVSSGLLLAAAGSLLYWIVPLPDLMSERRFYLPMVGGALAVAGIVELLPSVRRSGNSRLSTLLPAAVMAGLLAPLLLLRSQVWADPRTLWEEAARQAPDRARPLINLGVMAAEAGRADAAAGYLDRAVALEPENPEALFNRGKLRLDRGDTRGAAADLAAAVEHGPLMTRARINLAIALIRLGDLAAAEAALRQALALDPHEPRALTNLAEVLRATGRVVDSLPLYRLALEADPAYSHAAVRLGVALEALGDREGALRAYREYLRRGPGSPADREAAQGKIDALAAAPR